MTTATTTDAKMNEYDDNVPIIDLMNTDHDAIVQQIADACSTYGFFHVINHNVSLELIQDFRYQSQQYFTEFPIEKKERYRRNECNARGYFDNEYTKQRLDWKYCLDVGVPYSRDWDIQDNDQQNICLDGYNQLPNHDELPGFRTTITSYFEECSTLAHRIASYMMEGILLRLQQQQHDRTNGITVTANNDDSQQELLQKKGSELIDDLRKHHTSYLRMNYYRPCPTPEGTETMSEEEGTNNDPVAPVAPLGISPHRDAGFLTILLQDDNCHSLQVPVYQQQRGDNDDDDDDDDHKVIVGWRTVVPVPNGFTINTGDMAQILSNGIYVAPLHRVITHPTQERYSAPYFYNPGYHTWIYPLLLTQPTTMMMKDTTTDQERDQRATNLNQQQSEALYHPCLWGYYRAIRFAGDVTDLGVEIQVEDFLTRIHNKESVHVQQQHIFAQQTNIFQEPFSVHRFRTLFHMKQKNCSTQ